MEAFANKLLITRQGGRGGVIEMRNTNNIY